ncbi:MAG: HlyD family secretion protein [Pseudomonadales bacterium]|nr:HlyD family secretion protein [Pseudomonadales bacterium]
MTHANPEPSASTYKGSMRTLLMLLGVFILLAGIGYMYLTGGRYESTDDAYIKAARVSISADVAGRVKDIDVADNQEVKAGQVLFHLDDASFRIAVDKAKAELAAAHMKIMTMKAHYRQTQAEQEGALETLHYTQNELERQLRLLQAGVASQTQVDQATQARNQARSHVDSTGQKINAEVADLAGNPEIAADQHPDVKQAMATLDQANLNLSYTTVRAPADGIVTHVEEIQAGNAIAASTPVFALVMTHDSWIEANFKEDQITHMHPGQAVTVTIDACAGHTLHGQVVSMSPGTGSQFSVLPPENSTGNWVKVVQRLPVRIKLIQPDKACMLREGLSTNVSVDTGYKRHLFKPATQD